MRKDKLADIIRDKRNETNYDEFKKQVFATINKLLSIDDIASSTTDSYWYSKFDEVIGRNLITNKKALVDVSGYFLDEQRIYWESRHFKLSNLLPYTAYGMPYHPTDLDLTEEGMRTSDIRRLFEFEYQGTYCDNGISVTISKDNIHVVLTNGTHIDININKYNNTELDLVISCPSVKDVCDRYKEQGILLEPKGENTYKFVASLL